MIIENISSEDKKLKDLENYFRKLGNAVIAFSGGVDSTFLIKVAHNVLGKNMLAVTLVSNTFSSTERQEATSFCKENGIPQIEKQYNELEIPGFAQNPKNRCYICKIYLFNKIKEIAKEKGFSHICEGSNIDDIGDYRPGLQAIKELNILSPLIISNLTKLEIRNLSKKLELPTWNKPSYPCLATRFPYNEIITNEKLIQVSKSEELLKKLGFKQFRVRHHEQIARIEIQPIDFPLLLDDKIRLEIVNSLKNLGFHYITLDLLGFRSGSLNEVLKE